MNQYTENRAEAWREHAERFDCEHAQTDVRVRTIKGGTTQYVHQCLRCGSPAGNPLRKADFQCIPAPFDVALQDAWDAKRQADSDQIKARFSRESFFSSYDEYLKTPAWIAKRAKVIARAKGMCEGCGDAPAHEVHHLTYKHVGNEFLFELVALCAPCHERIHADE